MEASAANAFFGGDIELLTGSIIDYWLVADGLLMGFLRKFYGLRAEYDGGEQIYQRNFNPHTTRHIYHIHNRFEPLQRLWSPLFGRKLLIFLHEKFGGYFFLPYICTRKTDKGDANIIAERNFYGR